MAEKLENTGVESTVNGDFLLFRGRPLVREDNVLCYGSMNDPYIIQMVIMSTKEYLGKTVPDKVLVQLMTTDLSKEPMQRVIKQSLQAGLGNAMEIALVWLDRYLSEAE